MSKFLTKSNVIVGIIVFLFAFSSFILTSYPSGYTGRTLKTSTAGCGSCHTFSTNVTGQITGADTVLIGSTTQYNITVSDPNRNKAGVDIAARLGTLNASPSPSDLKMVGDEITHSHAISMTNHTVTKPFNYVAPSSPGIDTIFATISSGTPAWNWAPGKRVVVKTLTGVQNNNTSSKFSLEQNYPNPFNPSTNIAFEVAKAGNVKLVVFDILGNEIVTIIDTKLEAGKYNIAWNASIYSSGVYFYKLVTDNFKITKKMILSK
jgi:hypothetical protein